MAKWTFHRFGDRVVYNAKVGSCLLHVRSEPQGFYGLIERDGGERLYEVRSPEIETVQENLMTWLEEALQNDLEELGALEIPANPEPKENQDVHTEHCCRKHGCKYRWRNDECPVVNRTKRQTHPCSNKICLY